MISSDILLAIFERKKATCNTDGMVTLYAVLPISTTVQRPVIPQPTGPVSIDNVLIKVPAAAKLKPLPIRTFKTWLTIIAVN